MKYNYYNNILIYMYNFFIYLVEVFHDISNSSKINYIINTYIMPINMFDLINKFVAIYNF